MNLQTPLLIFLSWNVLHTFGLKSLEHEAVQLMSEQCSEEIGLTRGELQVMFNLTDIPDESDQHYKNYLACFYKKQNFMDAQGNVLFDNIKDYLVGSFHIEHADKITEPCKGVHGENAGDNAYKAVSCILGEIKRLDVDVS